MRIHHLDCGPARPPGGALMDGVSHGALLGRVTCHCLAIETRGEGVVLVDTGLGLRDMARPWARLPWVNTALLNFRFDPDRTMLRQLKARGIAPGDVRHIVMTHLDFDHAGGLVDFPEARVHLMAAEARAARRRATWLDRVRYRPVQWGDTTHWHVYPDRAGGRWFGFDAVVQLDNLGPEFLLVPLPGHSAGHAGVAVERGDGTWLLHAGDAYFNRAEVHGDRHCPPGAAAYEQVMAWRPRLVHANQARLRELLRAPDTGGVTMVCTHDPVEFVAISLLEERLAGAAAANDAAAQDQAA